MSERKLQSSQFSSTELLTRAMFLRSWELGNKKNSDKLE